MSTGNALGCLTLLAGCLLAGSPRPRADDPAPPLAETWRRPTALALADGRLYVANRRSGTITVVDAAAPRVVAEVDAGRGLADLALTPDRSMLLAADEEAGALLLFRRRGDSLEPAGRLGIPSPVSVRVADDGSRAFVASPWSRRLTAVDLGPEPRVAWTLPLPFAPRAQLVLPGRETLIVADAFGGRLAVVDTRRGTLDSVRTLTAHNIRGLALDPDGRRLLITHQALSPRATTSSDDIHWGNLLTNSLRSLSLTALLDPSADVLGDSLLDPLGDVGHGAGDPAGVAATADGRIAVASSGLDELALTRDPASGWEYVRVGRRPTAVAAGPDGRLFVANTLDDSISVVDPEARGVVELPLGPRPLPSASDRGERLFYDARLSLEGWMSCHSCHADGHTSGMLNDNSTDGSFGTPKRVLSLLGVADTRPWAWNGGMPDLESQVRQSVRSTMQGRPLDDASVADLVAFLKTLPPPPAAAVDEAVVSRGRAVFERLSCARCHTPPPYTSDGTYRVGLSDEVGNSSFNPPSLRGVGQGGPYFHDGRAATLEEVFATHRHQLKSELSKPDLEDLVGFLRSL